jgi:hypothetical protein
MRRQFKRLEEGSGKNERKANKEDDEKAMES